MVIFDEPVGAVAQDASRAILVEVAIADNDIVRTIAAIKENGVIGDAGGEASG